VPVGPERDVVHHLATIGLDRVEVGDPDPEEPAAERVVHPRDERLLVLALLGARHDVRAPLQYRRDERRDVFGEVLEVGRIEHEDVAPRGVAGGAEGIGDAPLPGVRDDGQEGIGRPELLEHGAGAVPGAVIHHHHLEGERRRAKGFGAQPQELGEILRLVLGRHQHTDINRAPPRREAHTRFRIRAGRMPS
jgi:hypothetical protein